MKNLKNNDFEFFFFFFWTLGYSPVTAAQGGGGLSGQSTKLLTVVIF